MRLKLEQRWTERLLELPESGMGYQRVDIRFTNERTLEDVVVFNAQDIEVSDEFEHAEIKDVRLRGADGRTLGRIKSSSSNPE